MLTRPELVERPHERLGSLARLGKVAVASGPEAGGRTVAAVAVAVAVGFGLFELRPELSTVAYPNDSSVHAEMVRFALARLREGHLPFTSWFPYLGLGSPQFLHYQSLGAVLTALAGMAVGPNRAFAFSLYLLLATWPVSVYVSARLLELDRFAAAAASLCSPLVVGLLGIGFGQASYLFLGFGLWAQLLAMWVLPLAWGTSWQAVEHGRCTRTAPLLVALTTALHFMTGYLAIGVLAIWPLLARKDRRQHLVRAAKVLLVTGLLAAWVVVPLLAMRPWASVNEFLAKGPDANSYGAPTVLRWLADGQLLDARRLPVLTVLAGIGLATCCYRARRDPAARAILAGGAFCLVLFFGRPTLGPLLDLLPGHADLFLRRFLMGVQLACLFLAGIGLATLGRLVARWLVSRPRLGRLGRPARLGGAAAGIVLVLVLLSPAWREVASIDAANGRLVASQQVADAAGGREVSALVGLARRHGPGRLYAGLPTNWGLRFDVGAVPVFRYLAALDVDEVGFTLRTASLMTDPEAYFDEANPGDYRLFGVRYLLLPSSKPPPVPARFLAERGAFALWSVGNVGLIGVVDTVRPPIVADRADLGAATRALLASPMPELGRLPGVAFGGARAAPASLPPGSSPGGPPGTVASASVHLAEGWARARVDLARRAVVLLKASYDPGWEAFVDGHRRPTQMVAPALVGVRVGPGHHQVTFRYVGYAGYPPLLLLAGLAVAGLVASWLVARARQRRRPAQAPREDLVP